MNSPGRENRHGPVAVLAVRRDEGRQRDHAGVDEQLADFADAADVFRAVFGAKPEVLVEAHADVVAVEHHRVLAHLVEQVIDGVGDRALAGAGKAREPQHDPLMAVVPGTIGLRDFVFVPGDVRRDLLSHERVESLG